MRAPDAKGEQGGQQAFRQPYPQSDPGTDEGARRNDAEEHRLTHELRMPAAAPPSPVSAQAHVRVRRGHGRRDVGAVPPAAPAVGEERGARGFVDMAGT